MDEKIAKFLPDIKAAIIFKPGEKFIKCCRGGFKDDDKKDEAIRKSEIIVADFQGYYVFTNKRFLFIIQEGLFNKKHFIQDTTRYEDIDGLTFNKSFLSRNITLIINDNGKTHKHTLWGIYNESGKMFRLDNEYIRFKEMIQNLIQERHLEIEAEKKADKIQYVMDFSFLKAEMEKGGITLTTVKCPSCGGNVNLPEYGNTFQCNFCNSTIHAHDIFDKMKSFLGNL